MQTPDENLNGVRLDAALDPFTAALLKDARRYDADAVAAARQQVKNSTIVTIGSLAVAAVAIAVAGWLAVTKKEVQPFVMGLDYTTGEARQLVKVEERTQTWNETLDSAFIATYTRAREEFSDPTVEHNYETVRLFSSPEVFKEYQLWIHPDNPDSPIAKYRTGIVDIQIRNISFIGKGAAQVRYTRRVKDSKGGTQPTYWIATIAYEYQKREMTIGARTINPLGMVIHDYRRDEEILQTPPGAK